MQLPERPEYTPIVLTPVHEPAPPPPDRPPPAKQPSPADSHIVPVRPIVVDLGGGPAIDAGPIELPSFDPGPAVPQPDPLPVAEPVRLGPKPATSAERLRPPYPESKRRLEEEAVLKLRLTIGADGRVTAVVPVGPADPLFLESARKHMLRHWRYRPATEDGRAVESTITVTIRFELEKT